MSSGEVELVSTAGDKAVVDAEPDTGASVAGAGAGAGAGTSSLLSRNTDKAGVLENWMHATTAGDLPRVAVTLRNFKQVIKVPVKGKEIPSVRSSITSMCKSKEMEDFHMLFPIDSLTFQPGTMTLLLGPPGAGTTTLLRAVANLANPKQTSGDVLYNGKTPADTGVALSNLVKYVSQSDDHMALLTVRETLTYAAKFQSADRSDEVIKSKVDTVLDILQLTHCQDTVVGNEFLRGISGGEKRRVTIGEMLCGNPRIVALDEISTGLDSSTAFDITVALRRWCATTGATVVAKLLQPIPEIFEEFDNIVLLQDGHVVYSGPRERAVPFIEAETGVTCPDTTDYADFLVEILSDPAKYIELWSKMHVPSAEADNVQVSLEDAESKEAEASESKQPEPRAEPKAFQPAELAARFQELRSSDAELAAPVVTPSDIMKTDFDKLQYGEATHMNWFTAVTLCLQRQARIYFRDKENMLIPWIQQALMQGLIVGALWFQLSPSDFLKKLGYAFFLATTLAFFNMVELPVASAAKPAVFKQLDSKFYKPSSYIAAAALLHLPFALINLLLLFTVSYFMVGFDQEAHHFFTAAALIFTFDIAIASAFRAIVYASPSSSIAEVAAPFFNLIVFIFSGFIITRNNIEDWQLWAYYLSPFAHTIRGLAQNEFLADRYDDAAPINGQHAGEFYLDQFDFQRDSAWISIGLVYNLFFAFVCMIFATYGVKYVRFHTVTGTARRKTTDAEAVAIGVVPTNTAIPFVPVTLAWKDVSYFVDVKKEEKQLLFNISGRAAPGKLIALMGASGAGKSTLLDVLADRKFVGRTEGAITVNGRPRSEFPDFNRIIAFCEQQDHHFATDTVAEAINTSAKMRLPASVSAEDRLNLVNEIIDLMELEDVRDVLVGGDERTGISAGQRKRLTIGVELAANPSILLCDEPTTGLTFSAAAAVMKVLRNVAATGRTVIATIHQPASELFFLADEISLLQTGGTLVYFGEIGAEGATVCPHFAAMPEINAMPTHMNPATWLLDVVSAVNSSAPEATPEKLLAHWKSSPGATDAAALIDAAASTQAEPPKPYDGIGLGLQLKHLFARTLRMHSRDTSYVVVRALVVTFVGLLVGLIFWDIDAARGDVAGQQSILGGVMLISGFGAVTLFQTAAPKYMRMRAPFYRETAAGMYNGASLGFVYCMVEAVWAIVLSMVAGAIGYFMMGLSTDADRFFLFYFGSVLLGVILMWFAIGTSALLPSSAAVNIANGLFQSLWWLFNGVFIPFASMPQGAKWFYEITFYHRSIQPMILSIVHDSGRTVQFFNSAGTMNIVSEEQYMHDVYGYTWDDRWRDIGLLFMWAAVFLALCLFAYAKIRHVK